MTDRVVGVVPAAGRAVRVAPLPCSKEIFPVGFGPYGPAGEPRPKPVCAYLLEAMAAAGARRGYVVIRDGKWDIPAALHDGAAYGLPLAHVVVEHSPDPLATLAAAAPFLADEVVLFGFPDIVVHAEGLFERLVARLHDTSAAAVLALFDAADERSDLVDVDADGRVRDLVLLPERAELPVIWNCAAWGPAFTTFLAGHAVGGGGDAGGRTVGEALRAALRAGLRVDSVHFPAARYLDIGTPEALIGAVQQEASHMPGASHGGASSGR